MKKLVISDDKLLDYLDNNLNQEEVRNIEFQSGVDKALKVRLEELRVVHLTLKGAKREQPSKNFTRMVMERLDQYPAYKGFSIRNGILLLTGVLVVVGLATLLVSTGAFDATSTVDLNQLGLGSRYVTKPLPSISFDGKTVVNIIIVLNLALAFIVLDRAILKPWFNRRMNV